jgi:hypothetical protein
MKSSLMVSFKKAITLFLLKGSLNSKYVRSNWIALPVSGSSSISYIASELIANSLIIWSDGTVKLVETVKFESSPNESLISKNKELMSVTVKLKVYSTSSHSGVKS